MLPDKIETSENVEPTLEKPFKSRGEFLKQIDESQFVGGPRFSVIQKAYIAEALAIAEEAHQGQLRDDCKPYVDQHILPVTEDVVNSEFARGFDEYQQYELIVSALLHDAYEDTKAKKEELMNRINMQFGNQIAERILLLSRQKSTSQTPVGKIQAQIEYLECVATDQVALVVKFADRMNNLQCTELQNPKARRYALESLLLFIPLAQIYPEVSGSYLHRMWEQIERLLPEEDLQQLGMADYIAELEIQAAAEIKKASET